jgi:hypothetical protein
MLSFFSSALLPLFKRMTQATIVTANGTTLTLSDTENADLFWGIRGGGSNFGVCTEFVLRLHPQRSTAFSGIVVFPREVLSELMVVLTKWWKNVKNNEAMHQILGRSPLTGKVGDHILGIAVVQSMTPVCRSASLWFCSTMGLRRKDVKITRNSMI